MAATIHGTTVVPVVSLGGIGDGSGPAVGRIAAEIDRACVEFGFFGVVDHGIAGELPARALDVARRFFALPPDVKQRWSTVSTPIGGSRGYSRYGSEAQAAAVGEQTPPDLSEVFSVGPARNDGSADAACGDVWPDDVVPGFSDAFVAWRAAADRLARVVLRACAVTLTGQADGFDHLVTRPMGGLRANHYPELVVRPPLGHWRGGAHTDYGTVTVLATDGTAGLEIETAPGVWNPVDPPPGGFLINIGDLLALCSGGRWRSTWHRVCVPDGDPPYPARTSLAFFQFPNADSVIDGIETATAGDYLEMKIKRLTTPSTST